VSRQQAEALSTVEALRGKYELLQSQFEQQFQHEQAKRESGHENAAKQFAGSAESTLKTISDFRDQAAEIVQIVGNIGVTGNYKNTAATESAQADTWRKVTLMFFVLAIVIGSIAVLNADVVSLPTTIGRMLFALIVAGVTLYTGRESARHRTNADRAKRLELELASLGPFIQGLDPAKQAELRAMLTDRYFGQEGEKHEMKSFIDPEKLVELLREAIKSIKK
jgi:hypothetical protein